MRPFEQRTIAPYPHLSQSLSPHRLRRRSQLCTLVMLINSLRCLVHTDVESTKLLNRGLDCFATILLLGRVGPNGNGFAFAVLFHHVYRSLCKVLLDISTNYATSRFCQQDCRSPSISDTVAGRSCSRDNSDSSSQRPSWSNERFGLLDGHLSARKIVLSGIQLGFSCSESATGLKKYLCVQWWYY